MMRLRTLLLSFLLILAAPVAFAASILIYGPSLGGDTPNEQSVAEGDGHTVTVVDESTWSSMTGPDFAAYDAIVFGEDQCEGDFGVFDAANDNKDVWSPVVRGNIVIQTFDALYHNDGGAIQFVENGINFASSGGQTGLYVSTACYADGNGTIDFLSEFGVFSYEDESGDNVTFVDSDHPVLAGLTEEDLEDYGQSWHGLLSGFPSNFSVVATNDSDALIIAANASASASLPADIPALSPLAMALLAGILAVAAMIALRFR